MTSSQFIIGYFSSRPLSERGIRARVDAVEDYVVSLHRKPAIAREEDCGPHSGIIAWYPSDETIGWPQFKSDECGSVAWVGIPEHDAMEDAPLNALSAARIATAKGFDVDTFGAPYACLYRQGDSLTLVNDSLGLARIFEFRFEGLVLWATRPGLAHIFAAEHVTRSESAWAGMATLGWNVGGHTHIGSGQQIPGCTRIVCAPETGVIREDGYADRVILASGEGPSWEDASQGMVRTMSTGRYFERTPIADLSGGKDSRLLAAAALTSGVTETVRTVRTDHGEVETAERLVELYDGPINHVVLDVPKRAASETERSLEDHTRKTIIGNEGAVVPLTALAGPTFSGYTPLVVARFNGHGGEALNGAEYFRRGDWRERLAGTGIDGATFRMEKMVSVAHGTSEISRERTMETIRHRLDTGLDNGIDTAHGLLNYFYSAERMPFWASSSHNRSVITPYYSSGLIHQIYRTFLGDTDFNRFYSDILSSLIPAWVNVPFYRATSGERRARHFFWETFNWAELRKFVLDRADALENYEPEGVRKLVNQVDSNEWTRSVEVSLSRFIWEACLDYALDDINARVDRLLAVLPGKHGEC